MTLVIKPIYNRWYHRFIPARRRQAKMLQALMQAMVSEKEIIDQSMERMREFYLYGDHKSLSKRSRNKDISPNE